MSSNFIGLYDYKILMINRVQAALLTKIVRVGNYSGIFTGSILDGDIQKRTQKQKKRLLVYVNLLVEHHRLSFIAVAMNSRDRYEIIGLCEISHFIKQPCRNFCLEKVL